MVICEWCKQEMSSATTCTANPPFELDGKVYQPIPAEEECGDCGVSAGGLHHPGCDTEICPCCGEQRLSCSCANPRCSACGAQMDYVGSDDERSYYECPACGHEQ